ncbi:hypothetical protein [Nocardia altamirensis]|uniref:hypothetical protein n=1 Tax=Nocardia altamirensis TaxID=472158 RepID=UPI00114D123C|nr:hypothetical protein [Nocardia altamirensis]
MSEAKKFAASMSVTMRRYAQAANWLERRKIRKEISRAWRAEMRQQDLERAQHLQQTSHGIDRYRSHSQLVAARSEDPNIDHDRRYRDAQGLARHRNHMAGRILRDPHLTEIERGIALDGLDVANADPSYEPGRLFARAHRVKGLQALRYRAQAARAQEAAGIDRPGRERAPIRYTASLGSQVAGSSMWLQRPTRRFTTKAGAIGWLHRQVADTHWGKDTQVRVEAWDLQDATEPVYSDEGRPDTLRGYLAAEAAELRERTEGPAIADRAAVDPWRRARATQFADPRWRRERAMELAREDLATPGAWIAEEDLRPGNEEMDLTRAYESRLFAEHQAEQQLIASQDHEQQDRYSSTITYLPDGANQVVHETGSHASELDSVTWTRQQLDAIRPAPGTTVHIAAYGHDDEGHRDPVFRAEGARAVLYQEVGEWRDAAELAEANEQQLSGLSAVDASRTREDTELGADLERELLSLKDRHRLSVQYNNALVERNAALVKQLTALTAERDELREANTELTDRLAVDRGPARDSENLAQLHEQEAPPRLATERAARGSSSREELAQEYAGMSRAMKRIEERDQAARAATTSPDSIQRHPIPGHAFAGLVNDHDHTKEMER